MFASHDCMLQVNLLDNPEERMNAARDKLVALRAITLSPEGVPSLTTLGDALNRMSVDINMGKCIVAAATPELRCSGQLAIIACMAQVPLSLCHCVCIALYLFLVLLVCDPVQPWHHWCICVCCRCVKHRPCSQERLRSSDRRLLPSALPRVITKPC